MASPKSSTLSNDPKKRLSLFFGADKSGSARNLLDIPILIYCVLNFWSCIFLSMRYDVWDGESTAPSCSCLLLLGYPINFTRLIDQEVSR